MGERIDLLPPGVFVIAEDVDEASSETNENAHVHNDVVKNPHEAVCLRLLHNFHFDFLLLRSQENLPGRLAVVSPPHIDDL